jgi:G patch domain/KOW motif-containing protein
MISYVFAESRQELESWDTRGDVNSTTAIPLIMRNKVPEGYETDDRLNVQLRPDEVVFVNYWHVLDIIYIHLDSILSWDL